MSGIHPEDAAIYVAFYVSEVRHDLQRIGAALERIATVLEDATNADGEPVRVAQSGEWSQTSSNVTP